jgi:hypothetical protein
VAPVVDLEDYRNDRLELLAIEIDLEAEERVCAAALVADWQNKLFEFQCPTAAFLDCLASAIDDALEDDDLDGLRERLEVMSAAARHEAVRRMRA